MIHGRQGWAWSPSDLRQPFGGTKASGTGREGGTWSYEVFCEPKSIAVSLGSHHIPKWGA